jgi:hypothetical protein
MYEVVDDPENCPVRLFEMYLLKRPQGAPPAFYLAPIANTVSKLVWFKKMQVDESTIGKIMPAICKLSGIERRTNHSLRAVGPTRMYEAGVDEQLIKERTGHTSDAVRVYKRTSAALQQSTSVMLHPGAKRPATVPPPAAPADPKKPCIPLPSPASLFPPCTVPQFLNNGSFNNCSIYVLSNSEQLKAFTQKKE